MPGKNGQKVRAFPIFTEGIPPDLTKKEVEEIVAGMLGTTWSAPTERVSGAEWTPSATKYVLLLVELIELTTALGSFTLLIGGKGVAEISHKMVAGESRELAFLVPPGAIVKIFGMSVTMTCKTRELL